MTEDVVCFKYSMGNHYWEYADGKLGVAPRMSDDGEMYVVDLKCKRCGRRGYEEYKFEGIQEEEQKSNRRIIEECEMIMEESK